MRFRVVSLHYRFLSLHVVHDTGKNVDVFTYSTKTHLLPYELATELCAALNENPNHLEN